MCLYAGRPHINIIKSAHFWAEHSNRSNPVETTFLGWFHWSKPCILDALEARFWYYSPTSRSCDELNWVELRDVKISTFSCESSQMLCRSSNSFVLSFFQSSLALSRRSSMCSTGLDANLLEHNWQCKHDPQDACLRKLKLSTILVSHEHPWTWGTTIYIYNI